MTEERIDRRCGNQVATARVATARVATAPSPSCAGTCVSVGHDGGGAVATRVCVQQRHDGGGAVATRVCVQRGHDGGGAVATWPSPVFPGRNLQGVAVGRGNALPHWEMRGVVYHVCFRLADSVPQAKLQEWLDERQHLMQLARQSGRALTDDEVVRLKYLYSENIEKYLDSNYGACWLRNAQAAEIVVRTLLHDDGMQYRLIAYGLMPNHCHVMIELSKDVALASVVQAWKSVSSHRINRLLGRKGELWQADYYNHIIRTGQSFHRQLSYVFGNNQVASWRFDMSRGGAE